MCFFIMCMFSLRYVCRRIMMDIDVSRGVLVRCSLRRVVLFCRIMLVVHMNI